MEQVEFLNFAVNAIILILVVFLSKKRLRYLRNILDILSNGGYKSCPFYGVQRKKRGSPLDLSLNLGEEEIQEKGGEVV